MVCVWGRCTGGVCLGEGGYRGGVVFFCFVFLFVCFGGAGMYVWCVLGGGYKCDVCSGDVRVLCVGRRCDVVCVWEMYVFCVFGGGCS